MKFLWSVTILAVFLLLMLLMKLNFKPHQVLKQHDRLKELHRPTAKIIIDDDFAQSINSELSKQSEDIKVGVNDDIPIYDKLNEDSSKSRTDSPKKAEDIKVSINDDLPKIYKERRSHVEEVCKGYRAELENDYKRFQPSQSWRSVVRKADVFHSRNKVPFLWCRVPKASSQSWNDLFINTWYRKYKIYTPGKQQMLLRRAWTPKSTKEKFFYGTNDRIFSFMISRHPFERILSAYRDKFFINGDDPYEKTKVARFYEMYGKEIIAKHRNSSSKLGDNPKYRRAPTFKEFLHYLVSLPLGRLDSHWLPTHFQCMPCHIQYSVLARIDTMAADSVEILKRIGVNNQLPFHHMTQGKTSDKTVDTYYADIERDTLEKLFQLYKMDFLLFGYTPDYFYNLSKNSTFTKPESLL